MRDQSKEGITKEADAKTSFFFSHYYGESSHSIH